MDKIGLIMRHYNLTEYICCNQANICGSLFEPVRLSRRTGESCIVWQHHVLVGTASRYIQEISMGNAVREFQAPLGIVELGRPGTKVENMAGDNADRALVGLRPD
jgi:hypothetical protein